MNNTTNYHYARELALQYLYAYEFRKEQGYDEEHLFPCKDDDELSTIEDGVMIYATYLAKGVIENLVQLDEMIERYAKNRSLNKIGLINKNILRLSIFSLLYNKEVHPIIIIDEAVKLSLEFSDNVTYKFVNGILDSIKKNEL